MTNSYVWVLDVGAGVGVFLIGLGVLIVCLRLSMLLKRLQGTLDVFDERLGAIAVPVTQTLSHVAGIADKADTTVSRLGGVVGKLESAVGTFSKTVSSASEALTPSIINVGAALSRVTSGMNRLIRSRNGGKHE